MKKTMKFILLLSITTILLFSLVGCSKYKYNYNDGIKKLQYDETLLIATQQEGSQDIIIKPQDGYSYCFVDATVTNANYGNYADILDYMKVIYTYDKTNEITDINKETSIVKTEYGNCEQTTYEYSYVFENQNVVIKSKAIKLDEEKTFVVIQKVTEGLYDQNTLAALDTTYNSCVAIK